MDLCDVFFDLVGFIGIFDDCGFVFGDDDFVCMVQQVECGVFQFEVYFFGDDLVICEDCDVLQLCFVMVVEVGSFDGD